MKALIRLIPILCAMALVVIGCPANNAPCTDNTQCTGGQVCSNGACVTAENPGDGGTTDGPPPKTCADDFECEDTERCNNGVCGPFPDTCTQASDCGLGRSCVGGACKITECSADAQCSPGTVCDTATSRCKKATACKEATDDCGEGMVCDTCREVCTKKPEGNSCSIDANCNIDTEYCDPCFGVCQARKKACEPCVQDKECASDSLDGDKNKCIADANGNKFCAPACRQGIICDSGYKCDDSDKLCKPASGNCASPGECSDDSDCSGSQICDTASKTCIRGCQSDAECGGGKKCCRRRCIEPCANNSQCQANEMCTDGCCKLDGECETSQDCPDKSYCNPQTGLCTPGCQLASDCGLPDPQRARCRFLCENNQCIEDCRCSDANLDCGPVRFCPKDDNDPMQIKPCRKPEGPVCTRCQTDVDCGCKDGDDCLVNCTRKECASDDDCMGMPNGATSCYNGRCSTKQVCAADKDCPAGERCENKLCAEACNNRCIQLMSGSRCFTGCNITGDGKECPSRLSCTELLPQEAQGPKCKFRPNPRCQTDADCGGDTPTCGPDGYCSSCAAGQICRGFNQLDPLDLICIPQVPTLCADFTGEICAAGGF